MPRRLRPLPSILTTDRPLRDDPRPMWEIRGYSCEEDYIADVIADVDDPQRVADFERDERFYSRPRTHMVTIRSDRLC